MVITEKGTIYVDYYSQIIVKLPKNIEYESVNVITRIYHGYSYSLFKGNADYASKLIKSEFDYIPIDINHKINMTISNTYLREKSPYDENNIYYIMFFIDDPEMIQNNVILTYNEMKDYGKIDIGKSKTILHENKKYDLPFDKNTNYFNIIYFSCANSLNEISIYNYNHKIKGFTINGNESTYQHILLDKLYEYKY